MPVWAFSAGSAACFLPIRHRITDLPPRLSVLLHHFAHSPVGSLAARARGHVQREALRRSTAAECVGRFGAKPYSRARERGVVGGSRTREWGRGARHGVRGVRARRVRGSDVGAAGEAAGFEGGVDERGDDVVAGLGELLAALLVRLLTVLELDPGEDRVVAVRGEGDPRLAGAERLGGGVL